MILGKSEKWKRTLLWAVMPTNDIYSGDTRAFPRQVMFLRPIWSWGGTAEMSCILCLGIERGTRYIKTGSRSRCYQCPKK